MSQHPVDPEHEHEELDEDAQLEEEDIVEVHEDDGDEPMDEDEDDDREYDGEIVIGGPANEEEEQMMRDFEAEDNAWGGSSLHKSQQSIFAIALHPNFPNPPLAISGGEDDQGFIFCPIPANPDEEASSSSSFSSDSFPAVKLTGHKDSVVAAAWNFDGEMVATGGMDGHVRVWRRVKGSRRNSEEAAGVADSMDSWKKWEFLTDLDASSEVQWLSWHPKGNVLAAGCEDSVVWLWSLPKGENLTVLSSHTLTSTCGIFPPPNGRQLLTTSLDSTLVLWEVSTSTPIFKTSVFVAPNSPELDPGTDGITSLAVSPNGQIAAVGGAAGGVKLVNLPKGDVVQTLQGHKEGESVEALVFVDLLSGAGGGKGVVLVSGGTDGKGFVWDVNTGRVRAELQHEDAITSISPHPAPHLHLVTSASADGCLKTWDIRTGALIATHKGHLGIVNGVAVARAPPRVEGDAKMDGTQLSAPGQGVIDQVIISAGDEGVSLIWRI
ncbi:WD40-repeat-containing domain protein [Kockovaella imperatae]|uniref:WD40-repeat-containing domain protein n=1 Tax=Kockovaella imperatae TaxID=4999 RepID=A0A1Y1USZ7_9TREE|nr:WD40-repeat-containing domain protein [Kockovaella imperatae]ORX41143.1 WD40-repeat-containing domain protein [Kockovaella imperatae]